MKEANCPEPLIRSRMSGSNTPGIISPGEAEIGFMPYFCYQKGPVSVMIKQQI
jgi:succinyl-CoA synthetase alpha subunit